MNDPQDSDLTAEERAAFQALPLAATPPADLEDRVVAALRERGLLRRSRARTLLRVAAAAALFGVGVLVGAALLWTPAPEPGPLFLLLLYPGPDFRQGGPADETARATEYGAWAAELRMHGQLVEAQRLAGESRILGAEAGPAALPAAPQGFFIVRARAFDEALAIARACPHLRHGGRVLVQPFDPV